MKKNYQIFAILLVLIFLLLSGCNPIEKKTSKDNDNTKPTATDEETTSQETSEESFNESIASNDSSSTETPSTDTTAADSSTNSDQVPPYIPAERIYENLPVAFKDPILKEMIYTALDFSTDQSLTMDDLLSISKIQIMSGFIEIETKDGIIHGNNIESRSWYSFKADGTTYSVDENKSYEALIGNLSNISDFYYFWNLEELEIGNHPHMNLEGIDTLTGIIHLALINHPITSEELSNITHLRQLEYLMLSNNDLESIDEFKYLTNLTYLDLWINKIESVKGLESLTQLEYLWLPTNLVEDVAPLKNLVNLTDLNLAHNPVQEINSLSGLVQLKNFRIGDSLVDDISVIGNFTNLETIYFRNNQFSDLSALSQLTHLKTADLAENQIVDVSPLANLTQLERLYLQDNPITDFSPLNGLSNTEITTD